MPPAVIATKAQQPMPPAVIASEARQSMSPEVPFIRIDPRYFRPTGVETLLGDPTKAKERLGWVPVLNNKT
jgi:GDPmannose 4,6-dehydratase